MKDAIVISAWSSISSLGHIHSEVLDAALDDQCYLTSKDFNKITYRVGTLKESSEMALQNFLQRDTSFRKADRSVQMALFAADSILKQLGKIPKDRIGVSIGSSRGATGLTEQSVVDQYLNQSNKTALLTSPLTTSGNLASAVANYIGAEGLVVDHSMTCSTAFQAIINAIAWIKSGFADAIIVGGSEAPLTNYTLAQLEALGIYSKDNDSEYPCRPLSLEENKKNTMTLGEGAALFVVEKKSLSELSSEDIIIEGVGFSSEKIPSLTGMTENGDALQRSMNMALKDCEGIDLLITHTPGTVKGDCAEINAVNHVFKEKMPMLYANKWKLGHTYGASAAFSLISAISALQRKQPLRMPYPSFGSKGDHSIHKQILINSAGFGGNSSSIVVGIKK